MLRLALANPRARQVERRHKARRRTPLVRVLPAVASAVRPVETRKHLFIYFSQVLFPCLCFLPNLHTNELQLQPITAFSSQLVSSIFHQKLHPQHQMTSSAPRPTQNNRSTQLSATSRLPTNVAAARRGLASGHPRKTRPVFQTTRKVTGARLLLSGSSYVRGIRQNTESQNAANSLFTDPAEPQRQPGFRSFPLLLHSAVAALSVGLVTQGDCHCPFLPPCRTERFGPKALALLPPTQHCFFCRAVAEPAIDNPVSLWQATASRPSILLWRNFGVSLVIIIITRTLPKTSF